MIISVRLDPTDQAKLDDIKNWLDEQCNEIFINSKTSTSETIRACINYCWKEIQEKQKS